MEASTKEHTGRRGDGYFLYSPCYCCEQVVKAFLKCLGIESHFKDDEPSQDSANLPLVTENDTKTTGQYQVQPSSRTITLQRAIRKPSIKKGKGGQHN